MRYHCVSCNFEDDSEFQCWRHARDTGHEAFLDELEPDRWGALAPEYYPLDDPDVLAYA